jgi:OOP family OmpA-OmpF porin
VDSSEDLYFGFNETVLTQESERQLQELLAALGDAELKSYHFQLGGHTCSIGSDAYNQKLSERRAEAVKAWLVKNGYPADRLQVIGFGKKKPVADNSTEEGRKLNRRVEIRTLGQN